MPFDDEDFDIVVSMNGFHAFPDEEELARTLHELYATVEYNVDGSIVYFKCVK